jgi:GDPmannose 4,6-dehydratase
LGLQDKLYLGNLSSKRDWGHAEDYVKAMWLMLQQDEPEDFVIATGITTEVREFVRLSFAHLGIDIEFIGQREHEKGIVAACRNAQHQLPIGKEVVAVDTGYYRPTEVDLLLGNPSKAREKLGWIPKYDLHALVADMVASDLAEAQREAHLKRNGYPIRRSHPT